MHGTMVCFALNNAASLQQAHVIMDELYKAKQCNPGTFPMVLVGCKQDIPATVTQEEIQAFQSKHMCPYVATSAKLGNVTDAFQQLALLVHKQQPKVSTTSQSKCLLM